MNTTFPSQTVSVDELLTQFALRRTTPTFNERVDVLNTAFVSGIHVYFQINVTMPLSAAEDDDSAERYLELMAEFAAIGEAAAQATGAKLLEVQADRLHLLVEDQLSAISPSLDTVQRLLDLAEAVINAAYERLEHKADVHWKGCCAAADFGSAALLNSTTGGGSVVSLGNAANRPAKRLDVVPAGCLSILDTLLPRDLGGGSANRWLELDLRSPTEATREFLKSEVRNRIRAYMARRPAIAPHQFRVIQPDRAFYEALGAGAGISPTRVQGHCFRADLDGFSKQVASAFDRGQAAVLDLVSRFHRVLGFPDVFARTINSRPVILPWAGDCATVLLLPPWGESLLAHRQALPVESALAWHKSFGDDPKFADSVGGAKWALGIAAGDRDEGNDGHMLVADIPAAGRTFRIAAGWAAKRASDAYQYSGVRGGDTVITQVDRKHLWAAHASLFADLGSMLAKATLDSLRKADEDRARSARTSSPGKSCLPVPIPSARPYFIQ